MELVHRVDAHKGISFRAVLCVRTLEYVLLGRVSRVLVLTRSRANLSKYDRSHVKVQILCVRTERHTSMSSDFESGEYPGLKRFFEPAINPESQYFTACSLQSLTFFTYCFGI